ncbi:hypothetical protein RQP46_007520 [Phenoliferia psychrophenolica]
MWSLLTFAAVVAPTMGQAAGGGVAPAALILNPVRECTNYYYPPTAALVKTYPSIWQTANLSGTGIPATDKAIFTQMNSSIPKIAPRGTRDGNFTGVVYSDTDPDCWWSWSTCTYYDYLETMNQKATLFYIGSNVLDWPLEAQRGLADGHELCAHTWSHPYMTALTNEEVFSELYYSKKAILEVTGVTVQCWRPPYGDVDDRVRWIAQALGMRTVMWAEDTSDWKVSTLGVPAVEQNYENILTKSKNGTFANYSPIVLTHELNNLTMELDVMFLPKIQATFNHVMPMGVCMNVTEPYVEQGGKYVYPNAAQWAAGTRTINIQAPTAASSNEAVNIAYKSGTTLNVLST